jgi:protein-S-isoprenylcysteine O-methyltransferase Ste14
MVLIAAILAAATIAGRWNLWTGGLWMMSLLVFGSAFLSLGRSLTISPIPNNQGLRKSGIYGLIRHPMYLALMLFGAGAILLTGWAVAPFLLLCAVLVAKISLEEKLLGEIYADFGQYQARTKRLIPFVW